MDISIQGDLSTRGGFIETIQRIGQYIADNAANLLGEYPSLLCEMDITARFRFDEAPTVEVRRLHIAAPQSEYPQNKADVDTLEKIARDMYREIEEHDAKHPALVPKEAAADAEPGGLPTALTCYFMFGNFSFGLRFSSRRSLGKANQVAVGIKRKPLTGRTGTRPPVRFLVA